MPAPSLKWVHKHSQAPENNKMKVKGFPYLFLPPKQDEC